MPKSYLSKILHTAEQRSFLLDRLAKITDPSRQFVATYKPVNPSRIAVLLHPSILDPDPQGHGLRRGQGRGIEPGMIRVTTL